MQEDAPFVTGGAAAFLRVKVKVRVEHDF